MNCPTSESPVLDFTAPDGSASLFATVFQGGVSMPVPPGTTLGSFLDSLPGFTMDYVADAVQTIFLDGTAIDDLQTPIDGDNPVLALSAAMPGLAGAILRRNSFHAALRTATTVHHAEHHGPVTLTLKLFNSIARDRGPALLAGGVRIEARRLLDFFATHPTLLADGYRFRWQGESIAAAELPGLLARQAGTVQLRLRENADD
ncbi:MAG: hypothetical protein F9K32_15165 [Desulfobulbaceae bacterium]|nr:MAG: hypothetical protein F9K32_15165 [Desulfobulbaceae bacterium]